MKYQSWMLPYIKMYVYIQTYIFEGYLFRIWGMKMQTKYYRIKSYYYKWQIKRLERQ